MSVPGSNLLAQAFAVIGTQIVNYRQFEGRTKNEQFQMVSSYGAFFNLQTSVQRVRRSQYKEYGLDFQRQYVTVFACLDLVDIQRDSAGDQFVYNGKLYQLENQGTWFAQDGWAVCMGIEIGLVTINPLGEFEISYGKY